MALPKSPLTWVAVVGLILVAVVLASLGYSEAATAAFVSAFGMLGLQANATRTAVLVEGVIEHVAQLKSAQAIMHTTAEEIKDHVIDIRNNPAQPGTALPATK